ncbi:hypothetical protein ACWGJ9_09495 [Curtobacterium citreum]
MNTRPSGQVNIRALTATAIVFVWAAVVLTVTVATADTPPSQFDYDIGQMPPSATDRAASTVAAITYLASLPVCILALVIAARSQHTTKRQVAANISVVITGAASLTSIGAAWVDVGTLVFFT